MAYIDAWEIASIYIFPNEFDIHGPGARDFFENLPRKKQIVVRDAVLEIAKALLVIDLTRPEHQIEK